MVRTHTHTPRKTHERQISRSTKVHPLARPLWAAPSRSLLLLTKRPREYFGRAVPCRRSAHSSFSCTAAVLALPVCFRVGIETGPRHMLTVHSSASGGCHATSCPYKEVGRGSREGKGSRKGEDFQKQPIEKGKSNKMTRN